MKKEDLDQLYHLLRTVSNEAARGKDVELSSVVFGMCKHLLCGGDYLSLIQYCAYYGSEFLIEPVYNAVKVSGWEPTRIVEFGAGLGWLGRGLALKFGMLPALFVDKRHWSMIDIVADLETTKGIKTVRGAMREGDLIVMSDFLHCVENPLAILKAFSKWYIVALELVPEKIEQRNSWNDQLLRYGGNPMSDMSTHLIETALGKPIRSTHVDPYDIMLIDKDEQ